MKRSSSLPRGAVRSRSPSASFPDQIGNWQVVRWVGQGAWSRVYQVRPVDCPADWPSDYALKLLRPDRQHQNLAQSLLRTEAAVAANTAHENLLPILHAHVKSEPFYLVMPFLTGCTLEYALLAMGRFNPCQAFWITRQVATALEALHQGGYIHADVKSSNISVSPAGHATLIDCGMAIRIDRRRKASAEAFRGTLKYAAPEASSASEKLTPSADVYSLGVTLFEMLTGRLPFETEDGRQLAHDHMHKSPPDLRRSQPHVPRSAARLLNRMLAKQPLRRPAIEELVQRLIDLEIETFGERTTAAADLVSTSFSGVVATAACSAPAT